MKKGEKNWEADLRKKAKGRVPPPPEDIEKLPPEKIKQMLHELDVYRAELEMQNEELLSTQTELMESRDRYSRLYHEAPNGHAVIDRAGHILQANRTLLRMTGRASNDLRNAPFSELLTTEGAAIFRARFNTFFKNPKGKSIEVGMQCGNSTSCHVLLQAHKEEEMHPDALLLTVSDITDKHRAEAAMLTFFEQPAGLHVIAETDGTIERINESWQRDLGYTPNELEGRNIEELIHPEDLDVTRNALDQQAHGKTVSEFKNRYRHKDGSWRTLMWWSSALENDGKIYAIAHDVTEVEQTQQTLAEAEQRLRQAVAAGQVGLWDWDLTTDKVHFSAEWKRQIGYEDDEISDSFDEWRSRVHPDDLDPVEKQIQQFIKERRPTYKTEFRLRHKNGSWRWILAQASVLMDDEGKPIRVMGAHIDITERRRAEEELRKSDEMMRNSQAVAHICSYSTDLDVNEIGKSTWVCSPEFYTIFGIDETYPHTIEGWANFIHPDFREELVAYHESMIKEKTTFDHEYKIIRMNDGAERWVHGTGKLVFDQQGTPIRMHGAIQDITERRQMEEELRQFSWLIDKEEESVETSVPPAYDDVTALNENGLILRSVGKPMLEGMTGDVMALLDTSLAVYEKNGDYAFGTFVSTWCGTLDNASRRLCQTDDNAEALSCGKWCCHESCWTISKEAMDSGKEVDRDCDGGLRIYAIPIRAGDEIIGVISIGYGTPPNDPQQLDELVEKYQLPVETLLQARQAYLPRPPFILDVAKQHLRTVAHLIGETVDRKRKENELSQHHAELEEQVDERTKELRTIVNAMAGREVRMADLKEQMAVLRNQLLEAGIEPGVKDPGVDREGPVVEDLNQE